MFCAVVNGLVRSVLLEMVGYRFPHTGWLADWVWDLRHIITFYEGLYVGLAAVLEVPLLTGEVKFGEASGLSCQVMLIISTVLGGWPTHPHRTRSHCSRCTPCLIGWNRISP